MREVGQAGVQWSAMTSQRQLIGRSGDGRVWPLWRAMDCSP